MKDMVLKIKKLLNLSNSSNENEANIAMLKAQELLVKHKLSLKEIEEIDESINKVVKKKTGLTFKSAKWRGKLASLIADNFGCYCYYNVNRTNNIVFLGKEEDVNIAEIVLNYAVDSIESACKRLAYRYTKTGRSTRELKNDYAIGFIKGLNDKFEKQKAKHEEWGIVLVKDAGVQKAYDDMSFTGTINTSLKLKGFSNAYYIGVEDGTNFNFERRVENKEKQEELMA